MSKRKSKIPEEFPYKTTEVIELDDIYGVINYVQISEKECSFIADSKDQFTMEHLFRDCRIEYKKNDCDLGIKYTLSPPEKEEVPEEAFTIEDDYDDEIAEDGQCF